MGTKIIDGNLEVLGNISKNGVEVQEKITSTNKLNADLVDDSSSTHKFITEGELSKLSGIQAGAEVNVNADWNASSGDAQILNKPNLASVATSGDYNDLINKPYIPTDTNQKIKQGSVTFGSDDVVGFVGGNHITITGDSSAKTMTLGVESGYSIPSNSEQTSWSNKYAKPSGGIPDSDIASASIWNAKQDALQTQTAYTTKGSATKVPQITTNALGQVTGITEVTITQPSVYDGTLTIQKNGTTVATFTANQSTNATANISVPTNLDEIADGSSRKLSNYVAKSGDTMTGNLDFTSGHFISLNRGASSSVANYISAGGGYSPSSGRYGVKVAACDQNDCLSGMGQDLSPNGYPYDFCLVGGNSASDVGHISFVTHKDGAWGTYRELADFYDNAGTVTFTVNGSIVENGTSLANKYLGINATAVNSDQVNGKHASDFVNYHGNQTVIGPSSPASGAKDYWANNIPSNSLVGLYNTSAAEYSMLFAKNPGGGLGSILRWGYPDNYLWILRKATDWTSSDWEKISAGNSDTVGGEYASAFAHRGTDNDLIAHGNEFNFVSSGYSEGAVWFNYRTASGNFDATGITTYTLGDGNGNALGNIIHTGNVSSYVTTYALPIGGGTMTGTPYINMPASPASISDSQPFGITYGRIQSYDTIKIAADTDGSTTEYVILTAGYGVANATAANGLAVGYNSLTWKGNDVLHGGNISSYLSNYLPLSGGTLSGTLFADSNIKVCSSVSASSPNAAAIEVREYNKAGTGASEVRANAPRIGFHWQDRYWVNLTYFNNTFEFLNSDCSGYIPIIASKIHSSASANTDITVIPDNSNIALETGDGQGGVSAWVWREAWAGSNFGIFHDNSADILRFVGASNDRFNINLGSGGVTVNGNAAITGSITNLAINGGIYWNPYVESSSDSSDAASIVVVSSGVLGGTELRISQQNDANDCINMVTNSFICFNAKRAFNISDNWLRINENRDFSDGVYFGVNTVRTDGRFEINTNGQAFYADINGDTYTNRSMSVNKCKMQYNTSEDCLDFIFS